MSESKIAEKLEKVRIPMMDYTTTGMVVVLSKWICIMFSILFVMSTQCHKEVRRAEFHTLEMIIISTPYEKRREVVAAMCPQERDERGKLKDPALAICKTLIKLWGG